MKLPSYPWRFAHLAALWGYGVSQPVFSLLKGNPEFLVITGATRVDTVAFALALTFLPPLLAVALEAVVGRVSAKFDALLHVIAVWLFGFTAAVQLLAQFDPSATWTLLAPAALAYVGAIAYSRWSVVRTFLSISVLLPVIGLLIFIVSAPLAVENAQGANIEVAANTPVVVVVFDEFALSSLMAADGSIDAARFPGFGRLAKRSTWYSRATSVYEHTTEAVPAILSGDRPRDGVPPNTRRLPGQPIHAARRALCIPCRGARDPPLSRPVLPGPQVVGLAADARHQASPRRRHRLPLRSDAGRHARRHFPPARGMEHARRQRPGQG